MNSRQLHYGFSPEHTECVFYCVLLHPMLLCASQQVDRDFISPIISDESLPYILLDSRTLWQEQILDAIQSVYTCRESSFAPLHIQRLFYQIWELISENVKSVRRKNGISDRRLSILKDMLSYIQENYNCKITLDDIAAAGNVSSSTCLVIFKKYLQNTPANYLIRYRLKKAMELLQKSDLSITEIAYETGFRGASYFAETFKKNCGCSPSEYRAKL
ncbi:MAG: helix-turn-helix transcriptional regulator [Clostridiales bacterium]|nr:helix-turn-helix transcriptional regulator [Clostridiales bacterium]